MLSFRLAGLPDSHLPLYLYGVGTQEEKGLHRPDGFPVYQLLLSRGGSGQLSILGRDSFMIGSGQLFVLEPGVAHDYVPHSQTSGELGYIGIGGNSAAAMLQTTGLLRVNPYTLSEFEMIWSRMTELWKLLDQGSSSMWYTSSVIYQFILDIAQSMTAPVTQLEEADVMNVRRGGNADAGLDGLNRAISLIHAHYQDDLLLKHVAEAVGYSVQHLNRLFHQHYDMTGHQYMQRWRLQKGFEWLEKYPRASVRQAAENVGMDVNYFIRMFKREFGETPGKGRHNKRDLTAPSESIMF